MTLIAERPSRRLDPALLKLAAVLLTGVLAVVFDTTIVSVALRTLVTQLHVGVATIQWVSTGYLLALGMVVPITGWLVDRYGGRTVWIWALTIFFVGSVAASLAWDAPSLMAFRIVQGVGGGLMLPVTQTLLMRAAAGQPLVYLAMVGGVVLVGGFAVRALRMRDTALVDLRLFRAPAFAASTVLLFLTGFVLYGAMLVLPLYFQDVRGHDALAAGLLLAPQGVGVLASRSLAGLLTDRFGPRWVVLGGLLITAAGTVPFALAGTGANVWILIVALVVRGIGLGGVTIP